MDRATIVRTRPGPRLAPVHADGRVGRDAIPSSSRAPRAAWLEDVDGRALPRRQLVVVRGGARPRSPPAPACAARAGARPSPTARSPASPTSRRHASPRSSSPSRPRGSSRVFFVDDGSTAIDAAVKMCAQGWRQLGSARQDALRRPRRRLPRRHRRRDEPRRRRGLPPALRGRHVRVRPRALPRGGRVRRGRFRRDRRASCATARTRSPPCSSSRSSRARPECASTTPTFLRELRALCDAHDVWLVADEVFTGYGRTGPMWACEHAGHHAGHHVHRQGVRRPSCRWRAVLATRARLRCLPRRARAGVPPRPHVLRKPASARPSRARCSPSTATSTSSSSVARKAPDHRARVRAHRGPPGRGARASTRHDWRGRPRGRRPRGYLGERRLARLRGGRQARRLPPAARQHRLRVPAADHPEEPSWSACWRSWTRACERSWRRGRAGHDTVEPEQVAQLALEALLAAGRSRPSCAGGGAGRGEDFIART